MAIVDPETVGALGGGAGILATLKNFWNEYWHRKDREEMEKKLESMNQKIEKQGEEISDNAALVHQTFSTKADTSILTEHLSRKFDSFDRKLDNMSNLIIGLVSNKNLKQ